MLNFIIGGVILALALSIGFAVLSLVVFLGSMLIAGVVWVCMQIGKLFRRR